MDFDPKCFFENPPRMKEDLKDYIRDLSKKILIKFMKYYETLFHGEKLQAKHVKYIIIAICPDPVTSCNRQGICIQQNKLKPFYKVLFKSIDTALSNFSDENVPNNKYGGLDKKLVKNCIQSLKGIKTSHQGILAMGAVISTVCSIMLQNSIHSDIKTLTLDILLANGMTHKSNTNQKSYPYSSLMRFLGVIESFEPLKVNSPPPKKKDEEKDKHKVHFTNKKSFTPKLNKTLKEKHERPSTPENCFWED